MNKGVILDPYESIRLDDRPVEIEYKEVLPEVVYETSIRKIKTTTVDGARRHKIGIKNLTALRNSYELSSSAVSKNLIIEGERISAVGFYCNEHIPETFDKDETYINYYFEVNGKDYEVVPINKESANKAKLIKTFRARKSDLDIYSVLVNEEITSLKLKISIRTMNDKETPLISDIKIIKR